MNFGCRTMCLILWIVNRLCVQGRAHLMLFVFSIRDRNKGRTAQRTGGGAPAASEKIGYVPRSNLANMKASGLSSTGGRKGKEQELDEESKEGLRRVQANDREIDQGIHAISNTLDNLTGIASHMKEEASFPVDCLSLYFTVVLKECKNSVATCGLIALINLTWCANFVVNVQTQSQNKKLEQIENNIQKASEKQAVVNVRQKGYLN